VPDLPQELSATQLWAVKLGTRPHKLVDIKTVEEVSDEGMIPGACNIVWPDQFQAGIAAFGPGEDILLYCRSGNRAGRARDYLIANGFSPGKVVNSGAFSKWTDPNAPTSSQTVATCRCLQEVASISPRRQSPVRVSARHTGDISMFDLRGRMVGIVHKSGPSIAPAATSAGVLVLRQAASDGGASRVCFSTLGL